MKNLTKKELFNIINEVWSSGIFERNPAEVEKNVREIVDFVIPKSLSEIKGLKSYLVGSTQYETCQNIHTFCRKHVKPTPDVWGKEVISFPYNTLKRGKGDCEDFAILIAALLSVCGIKSVLRVADCEDGYMHIYNYVPLLKLVVDGTLPKFGSEIKRNYFKDYTPSKNYSKRLVFNHKQPFGLGRIGINPKLARERGQFDENGNIFFRQSNITDRIIRGKDCMISFSLEVEEKGYYALIPADILQPSHLGNIENPLHFLPEAQPRNRALSESGAITPRLIAEKLRPAEISEGSTAYSGCPVINERGEVIQGNGRASTMKIYWEEFSKAYPQKYLNYLEENAKYFFNEPEGKKGLFMTFLPSLSGSFGEVNGRDFSAIRLDYPKEKLVIKPVLVRIIPCSDEKAIELGQLKQADTEAVSLNSGNIKSRINRIDDNLRDSLIQSIFPEGGSLDLSLSHAIQSSDAASLLIKKGIYRADEFKEKFIDRTGMFINGEGIKEISNLVLGLVFKDADTNTLELFKDLPDRVQTALIKSSPFILNCSPQAAIIQEVGNSIIGIHDYLRVKANGDSFHAWKTQGSMFGGSNSEKYNRVELGIIKLVGDSKTQVEIVQAFKKYQFLTTDEGTGNFWCHS